MRAIAFCLAVLCLGAPVLAADAPGTVVYQSKFSESDASHWNRTQFDKTPKDARVFLGPMSKKAMATLSLNNLPAHRLIRVRFTLFQLMTPDGNDTQSGNGPDYWGLCLEDGTDLVRTTFHYNYQDAVGHPQSFPDDYRTDHPAATGAVETGTLGYSNISPTHVFQGNADSVYKLEVIYPHSSKDFELTFWSEYTSAVKDEGWGLEEVQVEALPDYLEHGDAEVKQLWSDLTGGDPMRAWTATWQLAGSGPKTLDFVREQLDGAAEAAGIPHLVNELQLFDKGVRENARDAVRWLDANAMPYLRRALVDPKTPEKIRQEFADLPGGRGEATSPIVPRIIRLLRALRSREADAVIDSLTRSPAATDPQNAFAKLRWHHRHQRSGEVSVEGCAFTPDGKEIATISGDGIQLWDAESGERIAPIHMTYTRTLAVSPDGLLAAVGRHDGEITVASLRSHEVLATTIEASGDCRSLGFLPDGKTLLSTDNGGLHWWSYAYVPGGGGDSASADMFRLQPRNGPVKLQAAARGLAALPASGTVAINEPGKKGVVTLRDIATGKLTRTIAEKAGNAGVAASHDGKLLAVPTHGGVDLYDSATGELKKSLLNARPSADCAAFSPDDRYLCVAGGGLKAEANELTSPRDYHGVWIYRLPEGELVWHDSTMLHGKSVAFSPDGRRLVATDNARNVYVWDLPGRD